MHSISYCLNQNLNAIHVVLSFNLQIHSFNIVCFCFFLFSSTPFGSIECFLRFRCSKLSKPLFSLLYFLSATTSTYINIFNICVLYIWVSKVVSCVNCESVYGYEGTDINYTRTGVIFITLKYFKKSLFAIRSDVHIQKFYDFHALCLNRYGYFIDDLLAHFFLF